MKKLAESKGCMIVSCILALLIAIQHQYVYMYFDDYGYASLSYVSHTWDQLGVSYNFLDIMWFLAYHWFHWDGRQLYFFFEIVTFRLGGVELVQIVQAAVVILIGVFSGKLPAAETGKDSWKCIALSLAFYGLYDIATLNDGVYWYTASVLYVWPLLPLLAGIYLFAYEKEKCNKKIYMILCPVLFFMAAYSQEQMAVLTITCLWTMVILKLVKQRTVKLKAVPGVLLGSSISSFAGGLLCICAPGNFVRAGGSMYEDFYNKSFFQRIWEGTCSVVDINIGPYNWIFVILFTIMCGLAVVIVKGRKSAALVFLLFCVYFIFEHIMSISRSIGFSVRILWVVVVGAYLIFYFFSQNKFAFFIHRRDMFAGNAGCVPEYFHEKPYDAGIYSAHCNGAVPCGYLECIGKREAQKNYSGSQSACCGNSDIFCCEFYVCFVRLSRECGDESDQSCQDAGGEKELSGEWREAGKN